MIEKTAAYRPPNIFSIPQPILYVNTFLLFMTEFCVLHQMVLFDLYNIPG